MPTNSCPRQEKLSKKLFVNPPAGVKQWPAAEKIFPTLQTNIKKEIF
jgi:hypothetical protein